MTPAWALPYAAENFRAAALAAGRPTALCPECGAALPAPRALCDTCGQLSWCPFCGQALHHIYTRRCRFCAAPLACPFCGRDLSANPCGGAPPCRCLAIPCQRCGYNLTGNTTGRCPECGQDNTAYVSDGRGLRPLLTPEETMRQRRAALVLLLIFLPIFGLLALATLAWWLTDWLSAG